VPPFNRNTGGDRQGDPNANECHNDSAGPVCGRLKIAHRGVKVCNVCDDYQNWPDFKPGGRRNR
jgi:hypothetical protein